MVRIIIVCKAVLISTAYMVLARNAAQASTVLGIFGLIAISTSIVLITFIRMAVRSSEVLRHQGSGEGAREAELVNQGINGVISAVGSSIGPSVQFNLYVSTCARNKIITWWWLLFCKL